MTIEIKILLALLLAAPIAVCVLWLKKKTRDRSSQPQASAPARRQEDRAAHALPGGGEDRNQEWLPAHELKNGQTHHELSHEAVFKTPASSSKPCQDNSTAAPARAGAGETDLALGERPAPDQTRETVDLSGEQAPTAEEAPEDGSESRTEAAEPVESLSQWQAGGAPPVKNGVAHEEACRGVIAETGQIGEPLAAPADAELGKAGATDEEGTQEVDTQAHTEATPPAAALAHPPDDVGEEGLVANQVESRQTPRKYAGLVRKPPQSRGGGIQSSGAEPGGVDRSLPIEVRLRFERDGFCTVSLIARRSSGMPEQLTVMGPAGPLDLVEMHEDWYQDVVPVDIGQVLREGTVWSGGDDSGHSRWSLSGRQLYVLAGGKGPSGWVSQPSLQLGREHVVLFTGGLRSAVEQALQTAGAVPTAVLDSSLGAPRGWTVVRGIIPGKAVQPTAEADILNALRPLPEIEISLEGGIRLEYATWLAGFPPAIRVYGDPDHTEEVLIDGRIAQPGQNSAYQLSGWDSVGAHTIWCGGTTKSYSLVPFGTSWDLWGAYSFPIAVGSARRLSICGPVVHEVSESGNNGPSLQVPETHPVVLGAAPGEYVFTICASEIRGVPRLVSAHFRPVWALPHDPLRSPKGTRILLVGQLSEPTIPAAKLQALSRAARVQAWCRLILDASRKGLLTEPGSESVRNMWLAYKHLARQIWRARRT